MTTPTPEPIEDVLRRLKEQCDRECGASSYMQLDAVDFDRLVAEIERLRKENGRIRGLIEKFGDDKSDFDWGVLRELDEKDQEIERLRQVAGYAIHRYGCNGLSGQEYCICGLAELMEGCGDAG